MDFNVFARYLESLEHAVDTSVLQRSCWKRGCQTRKSEKAK